ncbi:hypothetical protein CD122_02585 [Staphylococcus rostri]|uniref:Uncharacterized protein n=1 Tax=Staphylococcus rostri TaxID=522262 RepID=A0A2K3YUV2_9STAP|nr:hypothetical protein CD122_02585 [Staphylococcus rostri]
MCTNDQGIIVKDDDVINLKSSKVDIKEIVENFLVSYGKKIYMTNYFRYITKLYPNESQSSSFINNLEYNDILIFLDAKYYPLLVWEPLRRNLIKLEGNRYIKYVSNEHFRIENILFEDDYDDCRKLVLDDLISCSLDKMKLVETYIGSVKDFTENSLSSFINR